MRAVLILGAVLLGSNAFGYKEVTLDIWRAPELILQDIKTVAVLDFDADGRIDWAKYDDGTLLEVLAGEVVEAIGEASIEYELGRDIAAEIRARLSEPMKGSAPVFDVSSRAALLQWMESKQLETGSPLNEAQAMTFGRELDVQGVVMGLIRFEGDTENYKQKKTSDGETIVERCRRISVETTVDVQVLRSVDGQIVGRREFREMSHDSACGDGRDGLPSVASLVRKHVKSLRYVVPSYVAPYRERQEVEFQKVKARKYRDYVDSAIDAARGGQLEAAYASLKAMLEEHPKDERLLYNLGVIHEIANDLDEAEHCFRKADDIKSSRRCRRAVSRVARKRMDRDRLALLGMAIPVRRLE